MLGLPIQVPPSVVICDSVDKRTFVIQNEVVAVMVMLVSSIVVVTWGQWHMGIELQAWPCRCGFGTLQQGFSAFQWEMLGDNVRGVGVSCCLIAGQHCLGANGVFLGEQWSRQGMFMALSAQTCVKDVNDMFVVEKIGCKQSFCEVKLK